MPGPSPQSHNAGGGGGGGGWQSQNGDIVPVASRAGPPRRHNGRGLCAPRCARSASASPCPTTSGQSHRRARATRWAAAPGAPHARRRG